MAGTLVANTINTDTGVFSTNNAYQGIAKAWVRFQGGNGTTSGVIENSFNVSSITTNSTGNYTVNFTTAMPNANYTAVANYMFNVTGGNGYTSVIVIGQQSTSGFYLLGINSSSGANNNLPWGNVVVLGS
jgi:hypothetical protein